jgi:hypothetical protein
MKMTGAIRINHLNKEILISKSFSKAAMNPNSTEYQDLKEVMCAHPDYRVAQRNIKKKENKKTFAGLTYEYMRDYLILHTSPEEEAEAVAELDEMILIARCHTPNFSYATIKKWFLRKFPEVAEFGTIEAEYKAQFAI